MTDYLWTSGRWPTARRYQWRRWCLYRGRWPLKGWMAELWWEWASSGHKFLNSVCLVSTTPLTIHSKRMRVRERERDICEKLIFSQENSKPYLLKINHLYLNPACVHYHLLELIVCSMFSSELYSAVKASSAPVEITHYSSYCALHLSSIHP